MAHLGAQPIDAGDQIPAKKPATTPGVVGYARRLSHPAYERLLRSENLLRKLVPTLIVIFLVVIAAARWIQINKMGLEIVEANRSEITFIADLINEKMKSGAAGDNFLAKPREIERILTNELPERYFIKARQVVLSNAKGVVVATLPENEQYLGLHLSTIIDYSNDPSIYGRSVNSRFVNIMGSQEAIIAQRAISGGQGGITIFQPTLEMMASWRQTVSTNVLLFVGTSSILLVILYAYFAQIARAKEADEIYGESQIRYDTAMLRGKCGLWEWDVTRNSVYWSDSMYRLLGYKPQGNFLGFNDIATLMHPDENALDTISDMVLVEHADAIDKVFRMQSAIGDWRWVRLRSDVVDNEKGEPHLIGIAIDVTEQEQTKIRNKDVSSRLHDAIENLSEAFVLWDNRKRLVMCNSKFQQLHGLDAKLVVPGITHRKMMEMVSSPLVGKEVMFSTPEDKDSRSFEVQLKDGRWLLINERRTRDGGHVSVGNDITNIKRHENKLLDSEGRLKATIFDLKKSRQKLELQAQQLVELASQHAEEKNKAEAANKAKSDFLANMSHELRTPLNAVIGFSEIMQTELFGPLGTKKYHEYCRDIHDSGMFLLSVINDILDMSKIESGRFSLDIVEVNINDALDESLRIIAQEASKKSITIHGKLTDNIIVQADRMAIMQILLNLLSNAVKFSPENSTINVRARTAGKSLWISIEDKGIGISAQDIKRLGRPFEQVKTQLTRDHKGSGLGLAISRSLTHMHNGAFRIKSVIGRGTIVSFQLPVTQPAGAKPTRNKLRKDSA